MIIEKTFKSKIALIISLCGILSYIFLWGHVISLVVSALGYIIYRMCDYIGYKKKKNLVNMKLNGKHSKIESVQALELKEYTLIVMQEDGQKHEVDIKKFAKNELTKLVNFVNG